jgi:hypothetical protein
MRPGDETGRTLVKLHSGECTLPVMGTTCGLITRPLTI